MMIRAVVSQRGSTKWYLRGAGPSDTTDNHVESYVNLKQLEIALELRYSVGKVERRGTNASPLIKLTYLDLPLL